jgi:hypothetical protein
VTIPSELVEVHSNENNWASGYHVPRKCFDVLPDLFRFAPLVARCGIDQAQDACVVCSSNDRHPLRSHEREPFNAAVRSGSLPQHVAQEIPTPQMARTAARRDCFFVSSHGGELSLAEIERQIATFAAVEIVADLEQLR